MPFPALKLCLSRSPHSLSPKQVAPPQVWDSPVEHETTTLTSASKARGKAPKSTVLLDQEAFPPTQDSGLTSIPHHDSSSVTAGRGGRLTATFSRSYIILRNVPEGQLAANSTVPCWPRLQALPQDPVLPPLHTHLLSSSGWGLPVTSTVWPVCVLLAQVPNT